MLYGADLGNIDIRIGFQNGVFAFTAAVLGGIGSIKGAVAGGIAIGLIKTLGGQYLPGGTPYDYVWIFVVLIAVHLTTNLLVGDGIHAIDFGFVAGKWAHPLWQFWDLALLWLAMLHGANGVRTIINDYTRRGSARFWLTMILYIATAVIIILGTLVIFTFDPCMVDASGALLEGSPAFCG